MRRWFSLYLHSARRARAVALAIAVLLAGFQLLLALAARTLQEMNTFSQLAVLVPDFLRQIFGPSLLTLLSFRGVACLTYFHVAVVATLVGLMISIGTESAREVESRFLDLLLAHPLPRIWIIARTLALQASCVAVVLGAMFLGTRIGLLWFAPRELAASTAEILPGLSLNLAALLLCWGGIAQLLASAAHRRSVAGAAAALLAMAAYMTDLISQAWSPMRTLAKFSPFHYYQALNLITGSAEVYRDALRLLGVAAAGFAAAALVFRRRDL